MKLYCAAASAQLHRAKLAMRLAAEIPGLEIVSTWPADVERSIRLGKRDSDYSKSERARFADDDLSAVARCDVFWLLSPSDGIATIGAWVELGHAVAVRRQTIRDDDPSPYVLIVSGPWRSIFQDLADHTFSTDEEALAWLQARVEDADRSMEARNG